MLVVNGIQGCPVKFKVTRYKIGNLSKTKISLIHVSHCSPFKVSTWRDMCGDERKRVNIVIYGKQIVYHKYFYLLTSLRLFLYFCYNYSVVVFIMIFRSGDRQIIVHVLTFFNHYWNSACVNLAGFLGQNLLDCKFTLRPRISAQNEGSGRLDSIHGCIPRAVCFVFQWKGKTSHSWN